MYPIITIGSFSFSSWAFSHVLGFLFTSIIILWKFKQVHLPISLYLQIIGIGFIAVLAGGKLYYLLVNWKYFSANPDSIEIFSLTGFGLYGELTLAIISIILCVRLSKYPVFHVLDYVILGVPLWIVLGRVGCFLAGDGCYGIPTDLPWGIAFPNGIVPTRIASHPTPIYEIVIYSIIFAYLWNIDNKSYPAGYILGVFLLFSGLGRFFVEFIRLNPITAIGLTLPQIFSLTYIICGLIIVKLKFPFLKKSYVNISD